MRNTAKYIFIVLLLFLKSSFVLSQNIEYVVKAGYIHKLTKRITWPENNDSTFNICVVGNKEFYDILNTGYAEDNKQIHGKDVTILYSENGITNKPVHLIFLDYNKRKTFDDIYEFYFNKKTLILTDSKGFCERGAHANFVLTSTGSIRLEMNESSIQRTGFMVDPKLIKFTDICK